MLTVRVLVSVNAGLKFQRRFRKKSLFKLHKTLLSIYNLHTPDVSH